MTNDLKQVRDALTGCKLKLQHSIYEPATHQEIDHVTSWNGGVDACIATLDRIIAEPSGDMPDIYKMKLNERLCFDHASYIRVPNGWVVVVSFQDCITSTFIPLDYEFDEARNTPY